MKIQQIKQAIKNIQVALDQIVNALEESAEKVATPEPAVSFLERIQSADWPKAVPGDLIATTEEDKMERADNILGFLARSLKNKKFLDFGCGDGAVPKTALSDGPLLSVGYDVAFSEEWNFPVEKLLLTNDFEKIKQAAPYDFILLYDVLDHVENPAEILAQVKTLCDTNTEVIVRCHPWCSRHGGHLYRKLNKAFAHLFLSAEEMAEFSDEKTGVKIMYPQKEYQALFDEAGYSYSLLGVQSETVEPYFQINKVLAAHLSSLWPKVDCRGKMAQSFVDYSLKVKNV